MVHFNRDDLNTTCGNAITQQTDRRHPGHVRADVRAGTRAGDIPPPVDDGDGHVDVSVDDFEAACVSYGGIGAPAPLEQWDAVISPVAPAGAGDIHLKWAKGTLLSYRIVAHELFHLVENAITPTADPWLQEGSAEWAASRATLAAGGVVGSGGSLDCMGSQCGDDKAAKNGYPSWMLFEYLTERYHDDSKVKAVWDQAAANPGALATTDLAAVLDVPLGTFFNDFATARLTGGFTFAPLAGGLPKPAASIPVATVNGPLSAGYVSVNHLAAQYIALTHGSSDGPCYEALLTISVAIPASVESRPAYWAGTVGATAQMLSVSGSNASITVPWNTCEDSPDAYLSVPNDTLNLDGRQFVITGSVAVDRTKPTAASNPPPGTYVIGSSIQVPASDPAPSLRVYTPEVLRVSTATRLLRFVVFSSGDGKLAAVLGVTPLGASPLRGGNNDVRFVLPPTLFKSLRTKSASNLLQLTSLSPSGTKGTTFTRNVIVQAPKAKPKKKPKKKH